MKNTLKVDNVKREAFEEISKLKDNKEISVSDVFYTGSSYYGSLEIIIDLKEVFGYKKSEDFLAVSRIISRNLC